MADEAKQAKDALYGRIIEEIAAAVKDFPEAELVPPEGFAALASGISKVWGQSELSGVMLREGKYGLILDVSVAVVSAPSLPETGRRLQKFISERIYKIFSVPVSAINIDILKIMK